MVVGCKAGKGLTVAIALLLACQGGHAQQQPLSPVVVSDGQGLADQLAVFGRSGADMVIEVAPPAAAGSSPIVSLQNVTFVDPTQLPAGSFSLGTVTVTGPNSDDATKRVVVDARMRTGLTPQFTGSAHLVLQNSAWINLCELVIPMDRAQTVNFTTGFNMGVFQRTRIYQSHTYINLTLYGTYADMVTQVYIGIVQQMSFTKLLQLANPVIEDTPPTQALFSVITPTMYRMNYSIPAARMINITYKSIQDPYDPVLQQMRADGAILPLYYCNGSLVGAPHNATWYGDVDPTTGPLYIADNTTHSVAVLRKAAQLTAEQVQLKRIPPGVMLLSNVSLSPEVLPGPLVVWGPMMLLGPVYNDPNNLQLRQLDLAARTGLLQLQPGAQLFMQQLVLTGLAQAPLPAVAGAAPTSLASALPLAAFNSTAGQDTWAADPALWLHECVLQLPWDDYVPLLSLALKGTPDSIDSCVDASAVQRAASLSAGITSMQLSYVHPELQLMVLSQLTGWGMAATALQVMPVYNSSTQDEAWLAACAAAVAAASGMPRITTDPRAGASSSGSGGGLSPGAIAGAVVGSVVGAAVLFTAVAALLMARRNRSRQLQLHKGDDLEQRAAGADPSPLLDPAAAAHAKLMVKVVVPAAGGAAVSTPPAGAATPALAAAADGNDGSLTAAVQGSAVHHLATHSTDPELQHASVAAHVTPAGAAAAAAAAAGGDGSGGGAVLPSSMQVRQQHDIGSMLHQLVKGAEDAQASRLLSSLLVTMPTLNSSTHSHSQTDVTGRRASHGHSSGSSSATGAAAHGSTPVVIDGRRSSAGSTVQPVQQVQVQAPPGVPGTQLAAVNQPAAADVVDGAAASASGRLQAAEHAQHDAAGTAAGQLPTAPFGTANSDSEVWKGGFLGQEQLPQQVQQQPQPPAEGTVAGAQAPQGVASSANGGGNMHRSSKLHEAKPPLAPQQQQQQQSTMQLNSSSLAGGAAAKHRQQGQQRRSSTATTAAVGSVAGSTGELLLLGYIVLSPNPLPAPLPGNALSTASGHSQHLQQVFSQQVETKAAACMPDSNKVAVRGVLGRGSWGTVYEGEWRGLAVAVKTLVFELMMDELQQEAGGQGAAHPSPQVRAIMEAAIAASVGHRNLVCTYCYDIKRVRTSHTGTCQGGLQIEEAFEPATSSSTGAKSSNRSHGTAAFKLFLVQELCGVSLGHALSVRALFDVETGIVDQAIVLHLLLDIASGLQYLHEHNIIHGDLKPANVLLKTDHTCPISVCAKLADFGLSSYLHEGATHVSNFSAGTPFYVAPEVIHNRRISTASDIYSFGVLMWQLFSGDTPYKQDPEGAYIVNPQFGKYHPDQLPHPKYLWLQGRCLKHNPHARPAARDLLRVLSEVLGVQPPGS